MSRPPKYWAKAKKVLSKKEMWVKRIDNIQIKVPTNKIPKKYFI